MATHRRSRGECVIALGGVGGDAHSVGLILLGRVLARSGFQVRYLATQNSPRALCDLANGADAVLISNMDGHAAHYLQDLPSLRAERRGGNALWYLGGNPSLDGRDEELLALGFDRVFTGYVEPRRVVALLDADLGAEPGPCHAGSQPSVDHVLAPEHGWTPLGGEIDGSFSDDVAAERDEVLHQWSTGAAAADLAANALRMGAGRRLSDAQKDAAERGQTLIHPRCGVADVSEQRELFAVLRDAGADVLSFQIDSMTRNNAYHEVEMVLKRDSCRAATGSALNGFPLINYGVPAVRALAEEFGDLPIQVRHSTRDPRLLAEIAFAGGVTAFEGGALSYNLPYYRDYAPRASLRRWRYVDALACEYYRRCAVVIDREFFGVLTASLIPPCVAIAVDVLEALLAAREGVLSVSLGYAEQGHRAQDIAAVRTMRRVARSYLDAAGHPDVAVHVVFHQYMGAFPKEQDKARQLIQASAVTAFLSGATRLMVKTPVEAVSIPTAADNAESMELVRATRRAVAIRVGRGDSAGPGPDAGSNCLGVDLSADWNAVAEEEDLIGQEAAAILDAVIGSCDGDLAEGVARAVESGRLDVPFSPSVWNAGRVLPVRDAAGAVRLAEPAGLPVPGHVAARHRDLVARRLSATGRSLEELIEHDILRVSRGDFDLWPLG